MLEKGSLSGLSPALEAGMGQECLWVERMGALEQEGRPGYHRPYPRPESQLPEMEPDLMRKRARVLCPVLGTTLTSMSPSPCSPSSLWRAGRGAQAGSPAPGLRGMVPVPSTEPGAFQGLATAGQCPALP